MTKFNPEELTQKMADYVLQYKTNRSEMTDDDIEELRASLSVCYYIFIENNFEPAVLESIASDVCLERTEGEIFAKEFERLKGEYSISQSIELARKYAKKDPTYLAAKESYLTSRAIINVQDKLMKAASQVLNSMAKRNR